MSLRLRLFQKLADRLDRAALDGHGMARPVWWKGYKWLRPRGRLRIPLAGGRFWVDTRDTKLAYSLVKYGVWEPEETALLAAWLAPGDLAVDVGANVGYHTVGMARRVGPAGHVLAFEAEPGNRALLERNLGEARVAEHTTVIAAAATAQPGPVELCLDSDNFGAHSLAAGAVDRTAGRIQVPGVTLDGTLAERAPARPRVRVVKSDTQGAEVAVLRGAQRLLAEDRPRLALEYWPAGLRAAGESPEALLGLLEAAGYHWAVARPGEGAPRPLGRDALLAESADWTGATDATLYAVPRDEPLP